MSGYAHLKRGNLTGEQVERIRLEYARGYKNAYQLGAEYGKHAASINAIVQGSLYKWAGGPITWPNGEGKRMGFSRPLPPGCVRGRCRDVACRNMIAASGWAQRMHMCESCFRINGGKKGRQKEGRERTATCRVCRETFTYYRGPQQQYRPKTCSRPCGIILSADKRRKRPPTLSDDLLYELYWGQNMTAPEIAAHYQDAFTKDAVLLWLEAAGIARRRSTTRTFTACVVDGCEGDIFKQFNGIRWYGRLCKRHLRERKARRQAFYAESIREERGGELAHEIAVLLRGLPDSVRNDAESEIMVAVLSSQLPLPLSRESVKPYIAAMFRENADAYKFLSLAAPTSTDEGAQTWGDRLGLS